MEFDEKAAARNRYHSHQHLKRVHAGKGRGRGRNVQSQHQDASQSGYNRSLLTSEDEEETELAGDTNRQSQGADLAQLLAESEQFYAQAHLRYRSFMAAVDTEPPPFDVSAVEKELVIEPDLLVHALAQLPLSEFLGIEQQFLIDLQQEHVSQADAAGSQTRQQQAAQQASHQILQHTAPHQQQLGTQPDQSVSSANTHLSSSTTRTPDRTPVAPLPVAPTVPSTAISPPVPADDQEDDVLQQLLSSSVTAQSRPAPRVTTATAGKDNLIRSQPSAVASSSVSMNRTPSQVAQFASVNATAAQRSSRGALPHAETTVTTVEIPLKDGDDGLNELLGRSKAAPHFQQASKPMIAGNEAAGSSRSKKQSLEDWLDGF